MLLCRLCSNTNSTHRILRGHCESTQGRRREVATYTSLDVLLGYCLAMLIFSVSLLFEPLATCHVSFARMF